MERRVTVTRVKPALAAFNELKMTWSVHVRLLIFTILVSFATVQSLPAARKHNITGCLTRLEKSKSHFKICETEVCFLFREEDPFIKIPEWMLKGNHEQYQSPFPCRNFAQAFNNSFTDQLDGISFRIHQKLIGKDHLCVWAGKDCTFNNMVNFIEYKSKTTDYKFAITGLLLEISRRVSAHLTPSSAIFDSKMIIIGHRPKSDVIGTIPRLTRAFKPYTWLLIAAVLVLFVFLAGAFVNAFCPRPLTFKNVFLHLTRSSNEESALFHCHNNIVQESNAHCIEAQHHNGQLTHIGHLNVETSSDWSTTKPSSSSQSSIPPAPRWSADLSSDSHILRRKRRAQKRKRRIKEVFRRHRKKQDSAYNEAYCRSLALCESSRWFLKLSFTFFLFLVVTFYEFAVVNYLFRQQAVKLKREVRKFEKQELKKYVVLKDSAIEDVWRKNVDPDGKYSKLKIPPWGQCHTVEHCFQKLRNESDPAVNMVTFDLQARYMLRKYDACDVLTVFETKNKMYSCGAGWLYGSNVKKFERDLIDKQILDMRLEDQINPIVMEETGGEDVLQCGQNVTDIDPLIIGIPLLVIVGPLLLCLLITLVMGKSYTYRRGGRSSEHNINVHS